MKSAERERELTVQYFRDELAKVETALAAIESADITDCETFATQFRTADQVVVKLHQKFSWAASEAAEIGLDL